MRRWVTRAMIREFGISRREQQRLEATGFLHREFPCGRKYALYLRKEVLDAVAGLKRVDRHFSRPM